MAQGEEFRPGCPSFAGMRTGRSASPGDVPGSRLLLADRAANLKSGSPQTGWGILAFATAGDLLLAKSL
jgi:hypothetical protein